MVLKQQTTILINIKIIVFPIQTYIHDTTNQIAKLLSGLKNQAVDFQKIDANDQILYKNQ